MTRYTLALAVVLGVSCGPMPPPTPPPAYHALTFTVSDASSSAPIEGARIEIGTAIDPLQRERYTNGDGFAHFGLTSKLHGVYITKAGYRSEGFTTGLPSDQHINIDLWSLEPPTPPTPPVPPEPPVPPIQKRTGPVRLEASAFADDDGQFLGLGATMMWGLHGYARERDRLDENLEWLADYGFRYVRILGQVGGDYWTGWEYGPDEPGYWETAEGFLVHAYETFGLRSEVSIFGEANEIPSASARRAFLEGWAALANRHPEKIIHLETANEYEGIGLRTDELRDLTRWLNDATDIVVAASHPYGGYECENLARPYVGGTSDLGTIHFDRTDNLTGGPWRPVRQPWEYVYCADLPHAGSNNEPIGPQSSVAEDDDPTRMVSAAIVSYLSNLATYVFHTDAGVRGRAAGNINYWDHRRANAIGAGYRAMLGYLPDDLPNWDRQNHHWPGHPFSPSLDEQIWPDTGRHGVVRAYGATRGNRFVVLPMGIRDRVDLTARRAMDFEVIVPATGAVVDRIRLEAGQTHTIRASQGSAFVLIGEFR